MIVVPIKEGENIEKALKKFKRKFEKTGVVKELRNRQAFIKPSEKKKIKDKGNLRSETATGRRLVCCAGLFFVRKEIDRFCCFS